MLMLCEVSGEDLLCCFEMIYELLIILLVFVFVLEDVEVVE